MFVVSLGAATLACGWLAEGVADRLRAVAWPALLVAGVVAAGGWRLAVPTTAPRLRFGVAAIDLSSDAPPADRAAVWQGYAVHVAALAASGAQVIVLPEKIETLDAAQAIDRGAWLSALAHRAGATVVAGVAQAGPGGLRNTAWLAAADGGTAAYDKRRLVPGWESAFVAGSGVTTRSVAGHPLGLAVCRDLDDTSVARDDARAGVAALLVPAWDFDRDVWMHARIAVLRGVEHGYGVVRSARRGLLTVSDRLGRIVAEQPSRPGEGAALVADLPLVAGGTTPYTRCGDVPAWACVAVAGMMVSWRAARRRWQR